MGPKMTADQKALVVRVSEILWSDWDPIGISDIGPRDEYESYVLGVVGLALHGHDAEAIVERLHCLETVQMGLPGNLRLCRRAAQLVIEARRELIDGDGA